MEEEPLRTRPGSDGPELTAKVESPSFDPKRVGIEAAAGDAAKRSDFKDELVVFSTRIPRRLAMELSDVAHESRWTRKRVTISELVTDAIEVFLGKTRPREPGDRRR